MDENLTVLFDVEIMPDENLIVYAKWAINQYTITFNSNGGTELAPITQDYDTTVVEPLEPTRVGYTFSGWYEDQTLVTEYIFTSMPASDITVYAKWIINQYTITFDSNDGTDIVPITQDYNSNVVKPDDPTLIGYTFSGWFIDEELIESYNFDKMPASDITVYAKWTINQYTITFNSNGTELAPITQDYDTTVAEPLEPTRVGYTFSGWYEDQTLVTEYIFTSMPASDITVYAKWIINQYTITFDLNGGTDLAPITQDYNSYVMYPDIPTKDGYVFDGWYNDESLSTEYVIKSIAPYDITLYAKWSYYAIQYDLYYNYAEVSGFIVSSDYQSNIVLSIPSQFNGVPVTKIKSNSFLNQPQIISLSIPNSVQIIEGRTLSGLSKLQNLTIPFIGYSRGSTNILSDQGNFGYIFGKI